MRVADYIVEAMERRGVTHVFMVTGGGAMFLNDAVALNKNITPVFNHHEQASAMAGVGYAKVRNGYGFVMTTTGCGSTNAVTGLLDAWQDNVRCVFVSGQAKRRETTRNSGLPLRGFGVQEADIISVVSSLTKYAVMVNDPLDIRYHVEKALFLAQHGRPGPVWLDVPIDVQGATVEPETLRGFDAAELGSPDCGGGDRGRLETLASLFAEAKRPVVIAGNGIRLAGAAAEFRAFVEKFDIPVVATFLGVDLLPSAHPLMIGRIGIKGDRAGNFAVQNSDLVLSLGSRLAVPSIGFEYDKFAREAKLVVVDVDAEEHEKKTRKVDLFIHADVKRFLGEFSPPAAPARDWGETCRRWKAKWPVALPEYRQEKDGVNYYTFVDELSRHAGDRAVFVSDAGSAYYVTSQAVQIRGLQRYVTSGAQADMGFSLPAAVGAAFGAPGCDVLAVTGDGSFQMNIQELQTLAHYRLPVKLFVVNNHGYLSIRATQEKFFEGRLGTGADTGLTFPDTGKIAAAYGLPYFKIDTCQRLDDVLKDVMALAGPVVIEVMSPKNQPIVPAVSSVRHPDGHLESKPLEDMFPFLERDEFIREMIVRPLA